MTPDPRPRATPGDIIVYSFFPWDHEYPSTAHGLARALTAHARVWFVSKPPTWKDLLATGPQAIAQQSPRVDRHEVGGAHPLMVVTLAATPPINVLPPGPLYQRARAWVDRQLSRGLSAALEASDVGDYLWINVYAPTQFVDIGLARQPLRRYYYSVDAIETNDYTRRHGVLAEAVQARRADAVLATSRALADRHAATVRSGGRDPVRAVRLIPNAIDGGLYLADHVAAEPDDLAAIPHPRLGYIGNLDAARIDYGGLAELARARPGYQLVLIGPWNASEHDRQTLGALPNVHLLGSKDQRECPTYLAHLDLGLIPFRLNDVTAAIYPLKINEYLAYGLPVVSTAFSADIRAFGDVITLAPAPAWPTAVHEALGDGGADASVRERRRARAAESTWSARARQFIDFDRAPAPLYTTKVQPA